MNRAFVYIRLLEIIDENIRHSFDVTKATYVFLGR
jgi:hypothetical protein